MQFRAASLVALPSRVTDLYGQAISSVISFGGRASSKTFSTRPTLQPVNLFDPIRRSRIIDLKTRAHVDTVEKRPGVGDREKYS